MAKENSTRGTTSQWYAHSPEDSGKAEIPFSPNGLSCRSGSGKLTNRLTVVNSVRRPGTWRGVVSDRPVALTARVATAPGTGSKERLFPFNGDEVRRFEVPWKRCPEHTRQ